MGLSRLDGWPARSPADASPLASRPDTHGSGPTWIATPSSYRTLTDYSWPVSRRTTTSRRPEPIRSEPSVLSLGGTAPSSSRQVLINETWYNNSKRSFGGSECYGDRNASS